jgi:hypothetical protein
MFFVSFLTALAFFGRYTLGQSLIEELPIGARICVFGGATATLCSGFVFTQASLACTCNSTDFVRLYESCVLENCGCQTQKATFAKLTSMCVGVGVKFNTPVVDENGSYRNNQESSDVTASVSSSTSTRTTSSDVFSPALTSFTPSAASSLATAPPPSTASPSAVGSNGARNTV